MVVRRVSGHCLPIEPGIREEFERLSGERTAAAEEQLREIESEMDEMRRHYPGIDEQA